MKAHLPALVVAGCIVAVGAYHGSSTGRWSEASTLDNPGQKAAAATTSIGDWHGEILPRDAEDDPKTSIIHCRFTHSKTGKWIMTAVSTGKPGYVAVHNPEHCYLGSGYKIADAIRDQPIPIDNKRDAHFWTANFQKKKTTGVESIRIYWGWTTDGNWQAPNYPRLYFAGRNTLHKLYFIHAATGNESPEEMRFYQEFMTQYIKCLNQFIAK